MSGHMGARRRTTKDMAVMRIETEKNLRFLQGAVPGPPNGFVQGRTARTGIMKKRG